MRYLTAIEAARRIGVAEKTIRLWIQQGKLEAHHPAPNRLAIAETDVERLALERQRYYGIKPETPASSHTLPEISAHDIETLFVRIAQIENQPEISVLTRELGKLQAKADVQAAHIEELERRIVELEAKSYPVIAENVSSPPVPTKTDENTIHQTVAQNRATIANSGMLSSGDFAKQIGIPYTIFDGYTRRGIRGEMMDITEVPHPTRAGYSNKFFTPEQQKQALALLKKHGKLPEG